MKVDELKKLFQPQIEAYDKICENLGAKQDDTDLLYFQITSGKTDFMMTSVCHHDRSVDSWENLANGLTGHKFYEYSGPNNVMPHFIPI